MDTIHPVFSLKTCFGNCWMHKKVASNNFQNIVVNFSNLETKINLPNKCLVLYCKIIKTKTENRK